MATQSKAFERGARRARYLRRLFATRGIVGDAINPYRRDATRADWSRGFLSAYSGAA